MKLFYNKIKKRISTIWFRTSHHILITTNTNLLPRIRTVLSLPTKRQYSSSTSGTGSRYLFSTFSGSGGKSFRSLQQVYLSVFYRWSAFLSDPGIGYHPSSRLWIQDIRNLRTARPQHLAFAGVTGHQLFQWYSKRRFCGCCGKPMLHSQKERMMECPSCGNQEYPVLCPAVIVGITNGDKIILSKYEGRRFKRYALIAGFAEIGETIEETVHREVMEEVGLKVKNLRYYKSQPWSFSGTLLFGFFCDVDGDDTWPLTMKSSPWHSG